MTRKKKPQAKVISEMTDIISEHLSKFPEDERKTRIEAFRKVINRGGKRASARPKAASASRTLRQIVESQHSETFLELRKIPIFYRPPDRILDLPPIVLR